MPDPVLPRAQATANSGGPLSREYYDFLRLMLSSLLSVVDAESSDAAQIASILARLDALEAETDATINGLASVEVFGSLESGLVQIQLEGDTDTPGNTYYYGTGPDGTKGWSTVESALDVASGDLTKTVGSDGVTTLGLDDTAVTPGSYSSANITVDAKGRITAASNGSGGGNTDPSVGIINPDFDFLGKPPTSTAASAGASYPWVTQIIGSGGGITSVNGGAAAPGVWRLDAGTANTGTGQGITSISLGNVANMTTGGGEIVIPFRFAVPTLSDGTNTFVVSLGMRDAWLGGASDRIAVNYTHSVNSGKLTLNSQQGGGAVSTVNGTTTVVAGTMISGRIVINAAGTQADLYVGSAASPEATITATMPTAAMNLGGIILKSAGTTSRTFDLDYLGPPQQTFTTAR